MSELAQGSVSFLAILLTVVSAWIQMIGGRPNGRIYYRLIFPLFFSTSILVISYCFGNFKPYYLIIILWYLAVSHIGHTKLHERIFECILYGLPSIIFGFTMLFTIQLIICICAALIGHFFNQKPAPKVEMLVNFLRIVLVVVAFG